MQSRNPSPLPTTHPSTWPLLLLLLLVYMAQALYTLPLNRVIELRLCQEHYAQQDPSVILHDGSIPEKLCKVDEVQRRLAWLQGIMETTVVFCDFLVTIPFSYVAERWGVRVVLWCNLVPRVVLSTWAVAVGNFPNILPTKAIIAAPIFAVLGAECVFQSTIFTLTSAVTRDYVERASLFSYISSTAYVVNFIGPTIASFTMSQNLWLPFYLNIALLLCAIPTISMLPHTNTNTPSAPNLVDSESGDATLAEAGPLLADSHEHRYANAFERTSPTVFPNAIRSLARSITGRRNFQILLCSFFLTALASSDTKLLVQYISKRYECTFSQAGYMLSAKAVVNFTLLAVIVPRMIRKSRINSKTAHNSGDSGIRINYLGAQISILISVVGVFCVALSLEFWMLLTALIIYALGSALPVFTMSLVTSPLIASSPTQNRNQDFSIVMLTKTFGSLVGAPLMTGLWVGAMRIGGVGLGLPYLVSGCVYLGAAGVVAKLGV